MSKPAIFHSNHCATSLGCDFSVNGTEGLHEKNWFLCRPTVNRPDSNALVSSLCIRDSPCFFTNLISAIFRDCKEIRKDCIVYEQQERSDILRKTKQNKTSLNPLAGGLCLTATYYLFWSWIERVLSLSAFLSCYNCQYSQHKSICNY